MSIEEVHQGNWFRTSYRFNAADEVVCCFYLGKTEHSMTLPRIKTLRDNLAELIDAVEKELQRHNNQDEPDFARGAE